METIKLPPVLPDLDKLIDIAINTGAETERFDFKEVINLKTEEHKIRLVRAVGAFGNTDDGGYVLIGITNNYNIIGLSDEIFELFDQTPVQRIVSQYLAPPPIILVRKHKRDGKRLVIVEVFPFKVSPSIVRQSATYGDERLVAGSILFRNTAAESAVITAESDMRKLCDIIVKRRASAFIELYQRGTLGKVVHEKQRHYEEIESLRNRADKEWPSSEGADPYIEVAFSSSEDLNLTAEQLKRLIPGACIKIRHGFPFFDVTGHEVYRHVNWGWYGRIPFGALGDNVNPPKYLWMLSRQGTFLDREHLWEDLPGSNTKGGIGLFHIIGKIVMLIRFLDSFSKTIGLNEKTRFRLLTAANNVKNRFLKDEQDPSPSRFLKCNVENRVEASIDIILEDLRQNAKDVALSLLDEVSWQFGRDDYSRQTLENTLSKAKEFLGREYFLLT